MIDIKLVNNIVLAIINHLTPRMVQHRTAMNEMLCRTRRYAFRDNEINQLILIFLRHEAEDDLGVYLLIKDWLKCNFETQLVITKYVTSLVDEIIIYNLVFYNSLKQDWSEI